VKGVTTLPSRVCWQMKQGCSLATSSDQCFDFHHCFETVGCVTRRTKEDKKLSYRRGTVQRALVNTCYGSRGMGVRKVSNSKSDLSFKGIGNGAIR